MDHALQSADVVEERSIDLGKGCLVLMLGALREEGELLRVVSRVPNLVLGRPELFRNWTG